MNKLLRRNTLTDVPVDGHTHTFTQTHTFSMHGTEILSQTLSLVHESVTTQLSLFSKQRSESGKEMFSENPACLLTSSHFTSLCESEKPA
jgi:hypothetical protein